MTASLRSVLVLLGVLALTLASFGRPAQAQELLSRPTLRIEEALLEGLSGKADYSQDGALTIEEISLWLSNRVKELTDRGQHPVTRRPDTVPDFLLALLK